MERDNHSSRPLRRCYNLLILDDIRNNIVENDWATFQSRQRTVINREAAYHEFLNKRYEKSMSRFQKSNVEVWDLVKITVKNFCGSTIDDRRIFICP